MMHDFMQIYAPTLEAKSLVDRNVDNHRYLLTYYIYLPGSPDQKHQRRINRRRYRRAHQLPYLGTYLDNTGTQGPCVPSQFRLPVQLTLLSRHQDIKTATRFPAHYSRKAFTLEKVSLCKSSEKVALLGKKFTGEVATWNPP